MEDEVCRRANAVPMQKEKQVGLGLHTAESINNPSFKVHFKSVSGLQDTPWRP